jgi:hypothetical protein
VGEGVGLGVEVGVAVSVAGGVAVADAWRGSVHGSQPDKSVPLAAIGSREKAPPEPITALVGRGVSDASLEISFCSGLPTKQEVTMTIVETAIMRNGLKSKDGVRLTMA